MELSDLSRELRSAKTDILSAKLRKNVETAFAEVQRGELILLKSVRKIEPRKRLTLGTYEKIFLPVEVGSGEEKLFFESLPATFYSPTQYNGQMVASGEFAVSDCSASLRRLEFMYIGKEAIVQYLNEINWIPHAKLVESLTEPYNINGCLKPVRIHYLVYAPPKSAFSLGRQ